MPDKKDEAKAKSPDILGFLTGRIREITALLIAALALWAVVQQFWGGGASGPDGGGSGTPVSSPSGAGLAQSLRKCLDAEVFYPQGTVGFSEWANTKFRLTGANSCERELSVHVAFRSMEPDIPLQPLPGCGGDLANSDCWAEKTLAKGKLDWRFTPPHLNPLRDLRTGDTASVQMKWVIFAEGGVKVRTDTIEIPLLYDLP